MSYEICKTYKNQNKKHILCCNVYSQNNFHYFYMSLEFTMISSHPEIDIYLKPLLENIPDPEIPVLSILDLGVIRKAIKKSEHEAYIEITPTYSGCPAMQQMEYEVRNTLELNGFTKVEVKTVYSPAWTTDWIPEEAKEKLKKYGIAPPEHSTQSKAELMGIQKTVKCPRCHSSNTKMVSQFGSTACKALYKCADCLEPFDYFKCI